jgi:hypothetical protein
MKKAKNLTIVPSASNAPVVLRSAIDPSCPQHLIKSKAQVSLPSVRWVVLKYPIVTGWDLNLFELQAY